LKGKDLRFVRRLGASSDLLQKSVVFRSGPSSSAVTRSSLYLEPVSRSAGVVSVASVFEGRYAGATDSSDLEFAAGWTRHVVVLQVRSIRLIRV
jgi:hypothetical protein